MVRLLSCSLLLASQFAYAGDIIQKQSQNSVEVTVDQLVSIVEGKGFAIAARIDHSAAAVQNGLALLPTVVLIFGNPKIGTQLMMSERTIGLDLPLRVLVWEKADGTVWLAYHDPGTLFTTPSITDRNDLREKMSSALDAITDAATE